MKKWLVVLLGAVICPLVVASYIQKLLPSNPTPPGGTNGQVQYNNDGSFGGFSNYIDVNNAVGLVLGTQSPNLFFAGPVSGSAAAPTYRLIDPSDIPALAYVTSVDMVVPTSILTLTGNPITSAGTLTLSLQTQLANLVWAGPTSGSATTPTFRTISRR